MSRDEVTRLLRAPAVNWVHDYAPSMGAALAFYTMFLIAPLLLIVSSIAGLVFGEGAVRAEIFYQLQSMLGTPGALAVQGLLESARKPTGSVLAVVVCIVFLMIGLTAVFAELQDAVDRKFVIGVYLGRTGVSTRFGLGGSLVVVLLWVYYSAQVFLFGAEFTWAYSYKFGSRKEKPTN